MKIMKLEITFKKPRAVVKIVDIDIDLYQLRLILVECSKVY